MSEYLLARNGQQFGPYSVDDLKRMVAEGQANATDTVWTEGMPGWEPLSRVVLVRSAASPPPPPPPTGSYSHSVSHTPPACGPAQMIGTPTAHDSGPPGIRRWPIVFYPKRIKVLLLLVVSAAFVALGVWLITSGGDDDSRWAGYASVAFFGLCFLVFVIQMFPGSTFLRLEEAGFTIRSIFREHSYRWTDIESFFVVKLPIFVGLRRKRMVGWNFAPSYEKARTGRIVSQALTSCDAALPDTYGKRAEELADLMNECIGKSRARNVR